MKFYRKELLQQADEPILVDDKISYDLTDFKNNLSGLRDLKNVSVFGKIIYDLSLDQVVCDLEITGKMVVGCAITDEDVDVSFETNFDSVYSFIPVDEDSDIIEVKTDFIDLSSGIFQTILFEVPFKVVKPGLKEYPKGDGWEVLKEEDFNKQEKPIDPRLAKLKEFIVK